MQLKPSAGHHRRLSASYRVLEDDQAVSGALLLQDGELFGRRFPDAATLHDDPLT